MSPMPGIWPSHINNLSPEIYKNGYQSGLNYFGSGVAGSTLWKAHYGMGFKKQLLMMTRAHKISWGHGFLRIEGPNLA
ncbi:hypothetical protein HanXRQr2_Chr11g0496521 [Helianthus annuus]|uniref:Uncharacterized protein n=1 Tax=Helianthus annuus TaxID=4232 RepID=A0A251TCE0_HELAN|nr:hypothetical protein HanXRQr2_Chr11g0496521 [Helianthus annuus]KAJ0509913.1 hypothetical protein HanIR_Chr11g0534551 [Helianthus annuus]KAJ0875623.1 hypothetical protein HanPSC8_Chr11g0478561 [Helianthus annuus]